MKRQAIVALLYHQLFPYVTRQSVQSAYASDGQVHGGLVSSVETVEYMVNVLAGTYRIASGVDVAGVIAPLGHPFETVETIGLSLCFYLIVYGVCRIVTVDVDINCLLRMKLRSEQVVIHCTRTCNAHEKNNRQCSEKDSFFLFFHHNLDCF